MTPRLYIAGPSTELERVRDLAARTEALGFSMAHKWWRTVERVRAQGLMDRDLSRPDAFAEWSGCCAGVRRAEYVWLLVGEPSEGSPAEFAFAQALAEVEGKRKYLIASGPEVGRSIVHAGAHVQFTSDAAALSWLAERIDVTRARGRDAA